MKKRINIVAVALLLALSTQATWARQVQLDVSMAKPFLLAGEKQNTFLKIGLTGFKLQSRRDRTPVNVAIVLDKSGSMSGEKIAKAKTAAIAAVNRLDKQDIISIVAYDSTVKVIVPATKLTDKQSVIAMIENISAGGSTSLFAGVTKGADEIRKFIDKNRVNRIILLSDGLANVGPQSPSELGALGASLLKEGISVSTMGLGLDYNEDLMTQLAQKSSGNHIFIEQAEDLVRIFNLEFDDVLSVVAQEVVIDLKLAPRVKPLKVLNMDAEINGQQVITKLNQLYSEQEKYILLEISVPAGENDANQPIAEVAVSYANMETKTDDRLTSSVSVRFSDSLAVIEENTNQPVSVECILQIANLNNEFATTLRDKGDIAGAQEVLFGNSVYLRDNAEKYNSEKLKQRSADNFSQGKSVAENKDWERSRKVMRDQQYNDKNQQSYGGVEQKKN